MKIGFLTACLSMPLEEKVKFAKETGFETLEVACWPRDSDRDYRASDLDVQNFSEEDAAQVKQMFEDAGLVISSLAYYDNNLHRDPEQRAKINEHTRKCIDAAALLGVESVGTFVGRNIDKPIAENFPEFQEVFTGLVEYAASKNIKLIIENCPMLGWQKPGEPGTISFSPELWEEMFRLVPHKNFGLNFDPSHPAHMLMDWKPFIKQFQDRIFHVHAKDCEVFEDKLKYYGVYNSLLGNEGWWRFRMPGFGQVDISGMIQELREIGYEGVISIEHEDPLYEGSTEKVFEGLRLGYDYLRGLV